MKRTACLLFTCALGASVHAQFFGGYADGVTSMPTGFNTGPSLRLVYDDFTFDVAGDITSFGIVGRDNTGSAVAIYWEIRSGVSEGNGGTLLQSGTSPSAVLSPLLLDGSLGTPPPGSGAYSLYEGGPPGGSPIHLEAGTYWIGLAPLEGFGQFDVASTQGQGSVGHPINNGNAFYYNSDGSANFVSLGANDFGLRIDTLASTVPEPSSISLLGVSALVLFRRRKR